MVVLVDDDKDELMAKRRFRQAPPVASVIGEHYRYKSGNTSRESLRRTEHYGRASRRQSYSRPGTSGMSGIVGSDSPNPAGSELSFAIG